MGNGSGLELTFEAAVASGRHVVNWSGSPRIARYILPRIYLAIYGSYLFLNCFLYLKFMPAKCPDDPSANYLDPITLHSYNMARATTPRLHITSCSCDPATIPLTVHETKV